MNERRGRFGARHERRPLLPRAGGWRYHAVDDAHYGSGAMVCRTDAGDWAVYDYRELALTTPAPALSFRTADEAKGAWDRYVEELHRASTEDHPDQPPPPEQA